MPEQDKEKGLARLREPFEAHQINKLPKPYKADSPKAKCQECGGYHGMPAVHLDYVGHAALTDRLLEVDPEWTYELVVTDPATGAPIFDANGGIWIRLTVCGVTRLGYGDAQGKKGGNAVKEAIGDALRNAGMRFGAALDLWHKGDLHDAAVERGDGAAERLVENKGPGPERTAAAIAAMNDASTLADLDRVWARIIAGGIHGVAAIKKAHEERKEALAGTEEPAPVDHWAVAEVPE